MKKKLCLVVMAIMVAIAAHAQFESGSMETSPCLDLISVTTAVKRPASVCLPRVVISSWTMSWFSVLWDIRKAQMYQPSCR